MSVPCDCLECRLRHALPKPVLDVKDMLAALSSITGEILAHGDEALARDCVELIRKREAWMNHPRVRSQIIAAGRA
jgi:hypothetical protein